MFRKKNKLNSDNSSSKCSYVQCVCGYKIPIGDACRPRNVQCPNCAMMIHIGNAKLSVSGNNASEVMQAMQSGIEAIKQVDIHSQTTTNVSVSGGSVQINVPNDNAELTATQVIGKERTKDGFCKQTDN